MGRFNVPHDASLPLAGEFVLRVERATEFGGP